MATAADILGNHSNGKVPVRWSKHHQLLCAERDRLLARDRSAPETSSAKLDDLSETASDESEANMFLVSAGATRASIVEVVEAIRRIERGTYGICEITGKSIEAQRLRAIPWARCSLAGQTELEKAGVGRKHALPAPGALGDAGTVDGEGTGAEEEGE